MNALPENSGHGTRRPGVDRLGLAYGLLAYAIWGVVPVFFKQLAFADALTIIAHRVIWSVLFLFVLLLFRHGWRSFRQLLSLGKDLAWLALSGLLVGLNWLVFVWAINHDRILETSLGYFITPLISVLLGMIFLGERLRAYEWLALFLAAAGTAYLAFVQGSLPWVSLVLAVSFGFYGLVKKHVNVGSLRGLFVETVFLLFPAVIYLLLADNTNSAGFMSLPGEQKLLLAASGVVTCVPLLAFASAARRLALSMLGFLQYLAPSVSALLAVVVYSEAFTILHGIVFGLIWLGLLIYSVGTIRRSALGRA